MKWITFAFLVGWGAFAGQAEAFSTGISSNSFGASGCNQCHSGGTQPTVVLSGPTSVSPGSTNVYTLTITDEGTQTAGGLNVRAASGMLALGGGSSANTQTLVGAGGLTEVTHNSPMNAASGLVTFTFQWTAPLSFTSINLTGWGNAVNLSGDFTGDRANSQVLTVMNNTGPTATPTLTSSPTPTPTTVPSPAATITLDGDLLKILDPGDPTRRVIKFKTSRDLNLTAAPSSDPTLVGAIVTVEGYGVGDGMSGPHSLPPSGWRALGNPPGSKGYKFIDPLATNGIKKVLLKPKATGGTLSIQGKGSVWDYQIAQAQVGLTIHLQIGSDLYCSNFSASRMTTNEVGRVVGREAPAPFNCEPAACGNGLVEATEECDDGDFMNGDGCSDSCILEDASALCAGIPVATGTTVKAEQVASGLSEPTTITAPPLDTRRVFVSQQNGDVRIIRDGVLLGTPFLDIGSLISSGFERGLLGLAFHPDYATNRRFFVNYTDPAGDTVIARYETNPLDPEDADEMTGQVLLTITQPFSNHNGGQIAFGPDGYLYVGMGDGGSQCDPGDVSQSNSSLLGKILRLDIDVEMPPYYAVPGTNPNPGAGDPLGLIWAKGFRNPWRFSFDRNGGDLYVADVGQNALEEINYQTAASTGGENYGWRRFEGTTCFDPVTVCGDPAQICPGMGGFTFPIHEYSHGDGCSVTGGFVYRGCRMPDLAATYFYGDWCTGFVRTLVVSGGLATMHDDITADIESDGIDLDNPTAFGEDARGELYIADYDGQIFKIVPSP